MHITFSLFSMAVIVLAITANAQKSDFSSRDAWFAANFHRVGKTSASAAHSVGKPGLLVVCNHGSILFNGRPDGRRLKLGTMEYEHGLICHANSRVVVQLPSPAESFEATIGVDANAGGGTVIFSATSDNKELFKSSVIRGGEAGKKVLVNLNGATSFTILAGDAGDGISSDHADWADAKVTLRNGTVVMLSDLPVINASPPARSLQTPPFSFVYHGKPSDELLTSWNFTETTTKLDANRKEHTLTYTDPSTGLKITCRSVVYSDFPTVEWTLYATNSGTTDTPILENIQALDTFFKRKGAKEFLLHHFTGSPCRDDDYEPFEDALPPNTDRRIGGAGGRPTNSDLCYFNIEWDNGGVIAAFGWPGQWSAGFVRDSGRTLRLFGGQELTHLVLHPGETIRTPLVVLQFHKGGDWISAQNIWRHWMCAHNMPKPDGKPVPTHYAGCWGNPLPVAAEEIKQIDGCLNDGVKLDYWFIDAGWYPNRGNWWNTGTWEPDPDRFPKGLREVADHLHEKSVKFIVWFEPERATADTWLTKNHPEWILGGANGGLVNMGNPEAEKWLSDRVNAILTDSRIDVFRTDYNIDPLDYWRNNDTDDRMGATENHYLTGLLAFWDSILKNHPSMYIDTCASGGRRNDLETLRRAVPLLRSDWAVVSFNRDGAIGQQCQTYGISFWMPYYGTGVPSGDVYTVRSSYSPAFRMGWDCGDAKRNVSLFQKTVAEFRGIAPYLLGDYYPLTPYSLKKSDWIAWQFDRPEPGEGLIQAFRREECGTNILNVKPRGLEPKAKYELTNADSKDSHSVSGEELMRRGVSITIDERPGSVLLKYRKAQ